jgi:hypothetical protein
MAETLRHGTPPTDRLRHERVSQPERLEDSAKVSLTPVAGWSIALLVSLVLWWGLWLAVSSLVSALL